MSRWPYRPHRHPPYLVPNGLASDEQYEREHHTDLSHMDDRELFLEVHRVQCALACERRSESDRTWLVERLRRVLAERRTRLAATTPGRTEPTRHRARHDTSTGGSDRRAIEEMLIARALRLDLR